MAIVGTIYTQENPDGNEYRYGDEKLRNSVAPDFDATHAYSSGDYCLYDGTLYKFNKDHTGAWDAADADPTNVTSESGGGSAASKADKVDLAPNFDATKAYHKDELVTYDNTLYKFTSDKDAGAWDSTKVETTKISSNIEHYTYTVTGTKLTIAKTTI